MHDVVCIWKVNSVIYIVVVEKCDEARVVWYVLGREREREEEGGEEMGV